MFTSSLQHRVPYLLYLKHLLLLSFKQLNNLVKRSVSVSTRLGCILCGSNLWPFKLRYWHLTIRALVSLLRAFVIKQKQHPCLDGNRDTKLTHSTAQHSSRLSLLPLETLLAPLHSSRCPCPWHGTRSRNYTALEPAQPTARTPGFHRPKPEWPML